MANMERSCLDCSYGLGWQPPKQRPNIQRYCGWLSFFPWAINMPTDIKKALEKAIIDMDINSIIPISKDSIKVECPGYKKYEEKK